MTTNIVLTGVGRDRVGIVAELSQILYELGCNLLDSSMTLLRGEFAVILMAQLPESQTLEGLRARLAQSEERHGMNVFLRELTEDEINEQEDEGTIYIISVYGADKPGIVAGVTRALANLGVNLTDVQTKRTSGAKSLFLMILEISRPNSISEDQLRATLEKASKDLGVETSMQAMEVVEL